MTRREMLVGLGGILATGTCPAVLNNVPLCLVGNLEVDKMETVVCNVQCSTSGDVYNWCVSLGFTTQNVILIRKSPLNNSGEGRFTPYCILCPVSAVTNCFRFNGPDNLTLGTVGSGRTETMIIGAGAEYYVFRANY